jgi:hypothetical protein
MPVSDDLHATGSRVAIEKPVIVTVEAATEGEANAKMAAFLDRHGWYEDADVYLSIGKVDLSGA